MDFWALIFFSIALLAALLGAGSMTNSVKLPSWVFSFIFLALALGAIVYQELHGEEYD